MSIEALNLNYSNLSPEIINSNVLPYYNLQDSEISVIKFKNSDKQRAVYKIDHNNKSYCLKKVYYDIKDLLYVYSSIEWLYRNNIRVPKLLPTIDNNRFVNYNNMLFILTPWVEGEKCSFDNINHIDLSIKKLAQIHLRSYNFYPIAGSLSRKGCDNYYISISKHFNDLLNSSNESFKYKDKFSKIFIYNLDLNLRLAKLSLDISHKIDHDKLTCSLCHGDYVNKNILFPQDLDPWIIDFDKCKYDYCAKDLSYFMRRLLKRQNTRWNTELALSILRTYNNIFPLSLSDFRYITAYLCFPQKFWKVSRDYYKNITKCNKSSFCNLLSNAVSKVDLQYDFAVNMIDALQKEFDIVIF